MRILLKIVAGLALLLALMAGCTFALFYEAPHFGRQASPSGRYEVVRRQQSFFLDSYETVWITTHGEEDPAKWQLIGPTVDGNYDAEWESPTELILTSHGWPQPKHPFVLSTFQDIRVQLRQRATFSTTDSPDGLHRLDVWTYEDSRGRRSGAMIAANWTNPTKGGLTLCSEGPWIVAGQWMANDHLHLRIQTVGPPPRITTRWRSIRITVEPQ